MASSTLLPIPTTNFKSQTNQFLVPPSKEDMAKPGEAVEKGGFLIRNPHSRYRGKADKIKELCERGQREMGWRASNLKSLRTSYMEGPDEREGALCAAAAVLIYAKRP